MHIAFLDEVGSNVVVRISKLWIDFNRFVTVVDRIVQTSLKALHPAPERICLSSRLDIDRLCVKANRYFELAAHLRVIGMLPPKLGFFCFPLFDIALHLICPWQPPTIL